MISNKPYLVRAFYDWIVDSACTPFVVINASFRRCHVPREFVQNDQITLNVSPTAVRDLKITNDVLEFRASFSGVVHMISAPVKAILAIYAQENQQGMFFDFEEDDSTTTDPIMPSTPQFDAFSKPAGDKIRPAHLKLVD